MASFMVSPLPLEAVDKRPSAALHSSFVTAADQKSSLIPQGFARLAYDHFSTASQGVFFDTLLGKGVTPDP